MSEYIKNGHERTSKYISYKATWVLGLYRPFMEAGSSKLKFDD